MNTLKSFLFFCFNIFFFGSMEFVFLASCQSNAEKTIPTQKEIISETSHELTPQELNGKPLFLSKCAACHNINKEVAANALAGVRNRWASKKELFDFIRNPTKEIEKNAYLKQLREKYKITMTAFPELSDNEIEDILSYIKSQESLQTP